MGASKSLKPKKIYSKHLDTTHNPWLLVSSIEYTTHFHDRMIERHISPEMVANIQSKGKKYYIVDGDNFVTKYHYKNLMLVKINGVFVTCMRIPKNGLNRVLFRRGQFVFTEEG